MIFETVMSTAEKIDFIKRAKKKLDFYSSLFARNNANNKCFKNCY